MHSARLKGRRRTRGRERRFVFCPKEFKSVSNYGVATVYLPLRRRQAPGLGSGPFESSRPDPGGRLTPPPA